MVGGWWFVVCGLWFVVCGLWLVVGGLWFAVCGLRNARGHQASAGHYNELKVLVVQPVAAVAVQNLPHVARVRVPAAKST